MKTLKLALQEFPVEGATFIHWLAETIEARTKYNRIAGGGINFNIVEIEKAEDQAHKQYENACKKAFEKLEAVNILYSMAHGGSKFLGNLESFDDKLQLLELIKDTLFAEAK